MSVYYQLARHLRQPAQMNGWYSMKVRVARAQVKWMSGAGPVLEPVASAASIMTRCIGLRGMRIEHRYSFNSHVEPTHPKSYARFMF